jgi:cytochrome c oxidase assembly factor CtaG
MRTVKALPAATLTIAAMPAPAAAHHLEGAAGGWTLDPWVIGLLLVSAALYAVGIARLWRRAGRGHGIRTGQAACFAAGWTALAAAVVSPLHALGERLFAAHMVEHVVLMMVGAPLVALARPLAAFLWALPPRWRAGVAAPFASRPVTALWRVATSPLAATLLQAAALWAWHAPRLFEAAVTDEAMHRLQHASFLVTALLFWWSLAGARTSQRCGAAVFYLFITALHSGLLGALLTLSPRPWYPQQSADAAAYGLTPLEDQQLGGLVMWVPAGLIYAGAALAFAGAWIIRSGPMAGRRAELG